VIGEVISVMRWFARRPFALLAAVLLVAACDSPSASGSAAPGASPRDPSAAVSAAPAPSVDVGPAAIDVVHEYTGGARADDIVPLIVAVHGLGDRPDAFAQLFKDFPHRAHLVFPAGGLKWGEGFAWWPITGVIDENSVTAGLSEAARRLAGGVRLWRDGHVAGKPIVTGFSQGGMLSFALATMYPKEVAEAVPVSGLLPPAMIPTAWPVGEPRPRILALHGDADTRVPYAIAQKSVAGLRALGLDVELKSYPGVAHTISAEMRRDLFEALRAAVEREKMP
jgi:phospholipase/carboxylesterase